MTEISEVPNVRFIGNAASITEDEGILTVCAVAGQLVQESTSVNVVITTSSGVARGNRMLIFEPAILILTITDALLLQLMSILKASAKSSHSIRPTR